MKIYFLFAMIISNCLAKQDPPRILHSIFSDSNTTQVYYGSLNFDTENFDIFNSLNINDIGNPQRIKYAVLPLT
ncbi:unnamed protein product, partial [Adineta steineri]